MAKVKDNRFRFDLRRRLVADARHIGIKPTARKWACSRNTVRLWLRRWRQHGLGGLKELSHAPHSCPHKSSGKIEHTIARLRNRTGYGPRRLKMEFDLPLGHNAIARILRERGLTRKRKTKRLKKNDLRQAKARLAAFERVQMDIKYLDDIAFYLPQMRSRGLPKYQYTIRDTRTGLLFLAFANHISKSHACACAARLLAHLKHCRLRLLDVTIQTDNGPEFDGQISATADRGFIHTVEQLGATHRFIPPGCPNANADVETSHQLIESEFYDRQRFNGPSDFLAKAWTYQCHFNLTRKNSYQSWRTPIQRLRQTGPQIPDKVALLAPVFLDNLLPAAPRRRRRTLTDQMLDNLTNGASRNPPGGQHQPGHPAGPTTPGGRLRYGVPHSRS